MALATCVALMRQAEQGQSWHVELSLARCGHWLRSLGREPAGLAAADPPFADVRDVIERSASGFGSLEAVRHAAQMERTAARWELPSVPLGSDAPIWR
jgi:hypothetical protein